MQNQRQRLKAVAAPADPRTEMARRELARRRLIPFCQYMWPGFETRPHRELIASALELCEARVVKRLMIFCPPQHGKSELVSRSLPPWWLGRNPDDEIIMASYAASLAHNLSQDARDKLMDPAYARIFGAQSVYPVPVEISDKSASVQEWRLKNHRGRVKATGVGGGITGHPADLLLIDDPTKDADEADSELIQESQINWYNQAAYTRLDPNGVVILTMTRWHERDLAGYLLAQQRDGGDLWYVLRLTAVCESEDERIDWCKRNYVTPDRYLVAGPALAKSWRANRSQKA